MEFLDDGFGWVRAATRSGEIAVYTSSDHGESWHRLIEQRAEIDVLLPQEARIQSLVFADRQNALLCTGGLNLAGRIYRSTDGGLSWEFQPDVKQNLYDLGYQAIAFPNADRAWVVGSQLSVRHYRADVANTVKGSNVEDDREFRVYPNPANDRLEVVLESGKTSLTGLKAALYSYAGRLLSPFESVDYTNNSAGVIRFTIDLSSLETGMYVLMIENGTLQHSRRFLKLE